MTTPARAPRPAATTPATTPTVTPAPQHGTDYVAAWEAQSRSEIGKVHIVRFDWLENRWECECDGFKWRGQCGHIDASFAALVAAVRPGRRKEVAA